MRLFAVVAGLALLAPPALAQTAVIAPSEAKDHSGQTVTIEGVVSEVHHAASGKMTFIDMGGQYPHNPFAGVIFSGDANKFPNVDTLDGKTVDITGRVKLYKGAPEIILNDPGQIKAK
jgi:DNA/RNA endonuclease YhcR with UshA esterase domain